MQAAAACETWLSETLLLKLFSVLNNYKSITNYVSTVTSMFLKKKCKATQQCGALTTWKMVFISIRSNKFHVHIILAAALHERLQSSKKAKN